MTWKTILMDTISSNEHDKDWTFLTTLQKEQAPWLTEAEIEECVVLSVVKEYQCYQLDWAYYNENRKSQSISEAA